jgi:glycosyltransferase involved in cell wall biosynthesis
MTLPIETIEHADPGEIAKGGIGSENRKGSASKSQPTVIITGPPWPRSGTGRVMQSQVDYYRERGYRTVFLCVPIHCSFTADHADWEAIEEGIQELGADHTFFAKIDTRYFIREKYLAWIRHGFRGTALDWIIFTARSAQLPEDTLRLVRELPVSLVHVNHVYTLGFARGLIRGLKGAGRQTPVILETHDIQSLALKDRGEINPWTHRHDPLDRLVDSEISWLKRVNVLVHVSVEDFSFFKERLPDKRHVLSLPTIDGSFAERIANACHPAVDPIDLLFVGQSTAPNGAAIRWFFEQVWPLIEKYGYRIRIVGGIATLIEKDLPELYQRFRSCFVGPVADLAPLYRASRCVFAPMVSGTGISIKTIEALATGKPFVGTSKAYRGMPMEMVEQTGLRAHDAAQDFADALQGALSAEEAAATASRSAYARLFSRQAAFASRDEAVKFVVAEKTH